MRKTNTIAGLSVATLISAGGTSAAMLNPNSVYQMTIDENTSSFTMNSLPGISSAIMTDNTSLSDLPPNANGVIDGYAGVLTLSTDASGINFVVTSFQIDPINATAGGSFRQYATDLSQMSGSIDNAGNMSLDLTGRFARDDAFVTTIGVQPFNVDASGNYELFTSGTACNNLGCISGSQVTASSVPNEFQVNLVSAGELSSSWGVFSNNSYFEVWSSQNTITLIGSAVVPVPASVWLFGSGLIGLIGLARRKTT